MRQNALSNNGGNSIRITDLSGAVEDIMRLRARREQMPLRGNPLLIFLLAKALLRARTSGVARQPRLSEKVRRPVSRGLLIPMHRSSAIPPLAKPPAQTWAPTR
eukprot:3201812-Pyramimonas_sp.AAC.1